MIKICYFSGTGNTKIIVDILAKNLSDSGEDVCVKSMESGEDTSFNFDTLIIAYPIHGFNAPTNVLRYVDALSVCNQKVYLIKTSGEPLSLNDASSQDIIKTLQQKGYDYKGEYHFIMPYNILFKHTDEMASKMFCVARDKVRKASFDILNKKNHIIHPSFVSKLFKKVCKIEQWGMRFNGKKYKVNQNTCIKCMRCIKDCPMKNIIFDGKKFIFSKNCIGCMRCSFNCPTDSIKIGILNCWRVNGKYDFSKNPDYAIIPKYCNKAYKKYFNE